MKFSILVAVEKYIDPEIRPVGYAASDARAFADVLEPHGFAPANREILINEQATKTSLESVIRTTFKRLTPTDTLIVFYAGHGFSGPGSAGYLACVDTRPGDAEETSLGVAWLLERMKASKCRNVVMFLDARHGQLVAGEAGDASHRSFDDAELRGHFDNAQSGACFTSCRPEEISHPSSALKHGLWAYHLVEAFDGRAKAALDGERLTIRSLQSHLQTAVPATLRLTNPGSVQTPEVFSAPFANFQLADLEEVLAQRAAAKPLPDGQVKDSILLRVSSTKVKSLAGFKKGKVHVVPDRHSGSAQAFISEVASDDIKEQVAQIRAALKNQFGFTRLQLSVETHQGAASITTPYFNYNLSVEQDPADPASVVWRRTVDSITNPAQVLSDEFESVFAGVFDSVELSLRSKVNLEELIDFVESLGSDKIRVEYGAGEPITACEVRLKGCGARIQVTPRTFSIVHPRPDSPRMLLKSLLEIQRSLTDGHKVLSIPFDSSDSTPS